MSMPASAQRLRVAVVLAICGALALGSFWILEVLRQERENAVADMPRDEADYVVERFNFIRMSKDGQARYNVSGSKLTHFPTDDSFEILQPVLHDLTPGRPAMTLKAERAKVENTGNKIHLYKDVQLDRPDSADSQSLTVRTDYLLILPDDDILKTDKPVRLTSGLSEVSAQGMVINNAERKMEMTGRIHGSTPPRAEKPGA